MKKVWKWVIGIVIVLVVVAALVTGAILLRNHFGLTRVTRLTQPGFGYGQRGPGLRPFAYGMPMRGYGMMGFGWGGLLGGLFGGLFCLGILALVVLGIIWLVNRLRRPTTVSAPMANASSSVTPVAQPVAPVAPVAERVASSAPVVATHSCKKCGELVQDGWTYCPNCGKKQ
jgi:hypothetical protein